MIVLAGAGLIYGGFSSYGDQTSGIPGQAKVTACEGGQKYSPGIHCRGSWKLGGSLVGGDGRIVVGRIQNAGYGDIGKTIDVRLHGTDHATKPSLGTAIMFWALGAAVAGFGILALVMKPKRQAA